MPQIAKIYIQYISEALKYLLIPFSAYTLDFMLGMRLLTISEHQGVLFSN